MRIIATLLFLIIGISLNLDAQKYARYSQYQFNGLLINPAYAGSMDGTSYTGFFRQQWAAIEGAPQNIVLSLHSRTAKWDNVGVGFFLENDRLGLTNLFNVMGVFSYSFELENGTLATGLQGGVQYFTSNLAGGIIEDPEILQNESRLQPNFGAGLYYYNDDKWYVGASIPYLIEKGNFYNPADDLSVSLVSQSLQILTTFGYVMEFSDNLDFKPSALLKILPTYEVDPLQMDISANFLIKKTFWVGATGRFNSGAKVESAILMLASDFSNGLRLGYAYDFSFGTSSGNVYASSHEVMVGYDITRSNKRGKQVRYF